MKPAIHSIVAGSVEVGGLDADVELAGDAGRVLQVVQVLRPRARFLGGERADVGDRLDLGADAPADDGQGQADAQDALGRVEG